MARREAQARSVPPWEGSPPRSESHLAIAGGTARPSPSPDNAVERAERALAERVKTFTEASEALRAEIISFSEALAKAQGRPAEPELRLVVNRDTGEVEAVERADREDDEPPTPEQIAQFFRNHEAREDPGDEAVAALASPGPSQAQAPPRNLARERLYADIGGTIIGLSGAAALINFVILK